MPYICQNFVFFLPIFVFITLFLFYTQLLPRSSRHHRRLRCDRPGVVQQRQTMAARDRPLRLRKRQQTARRKQMRSDHKEGCRLHDCKGKISLSFYIR